MNIHELMLGAKLTWMSLHYCTSSRWLLSVLLHRKSLHRKESYHRVKRMLAHWSNADHFTCRQELLAQYLKFVQLERFQDWPRLEQQLLARENKIVVSCYSTAPAIMVRIYQAFVLSFSRARVPADHRNPQNVHSIPLSTKSTTNLSKIQESPLRFTKFKAFLALLLLPSLRIAETEQLETWIWTEVANIWSGASQLELVWKVLQLTMYQPWKSQICVNYGSPRYVKLGSVRMLYHTVIFGCWGLLRWCRESNWPLFRSHQQISGEPSSHFVALAVGGRSANFPTLETAFMQQAHRLHRFHFFLQASQSRLHKHPTWFILTSSLTRVSRFA